MTTSTLKVGDLLSIMSARGIEHQVHRLEAASLTRPRIRNRSAMVPVRYLLP